MVSLRVLGGSSASSGEQIGHHVVNERNLQKVEARKYMGPEEIELLEERNLKKYKNPVGPTLAQRRNKPC